MRVGVGRRAAAARADAGRAGAVGGPVAARARSAGRRRGRSCVGLAAALVLGAALAVAMHLVPCGRPGAAAARGRLAGGADPGRRAADRARARLRAGAEDPDHRADLLLPGRRQRLPTGCATATRTRASCCARWTRRAGSGCASWTAPSALPAGFTGMKVAAAVAVIGAVLAEWSGSDSGLGHLLITANGQLETARAFAATALLMAEAIALYALVRVARAPRRHLGADGMKTIDPAALLASVLAGCGEKAEPSGDAPVRAGAVHGHARLLPQRRPRRDLRRQGGRALRQGRARREDPDAAGPVRAAEAAARGQGRPRDLLRARAAARARRRARRTSSPSARSCRCR